jgi:hypothetical protein
MFDDPIVSINITVVVHYKDKQWHAQALEHAITESAETIERSIEWLHNAIVAALAVCNHERHDFFANYPPADPEYWDMWRDQRSGFTNRDPIFVNILNYQLTICPKVLGGTN